MENELEFSLVIFNMQPSPVMQSLARPIVELVTTF